MAIFRLRQVFSLFRRNAAVMQPEIEPVLDPKVQAYLNFLRDHGPQADYAAPAEEEPMLQLPWAA